MNGLHTDRIDPLIVEDLKYLKAAGCNVAGAQRLLAPNDQEDRLDVGDVCRWLLKHATATQRLDFLSAAVSANQDWRTLVKAWRTQLKVSGEEWPKEMLTVRAVCDSRKAGTARSPKRAAYLRAFIAQLIERRFPFKHGAQTIVAKTARVMLRAPVTVQQVNQTIRAIRKLNDSRIE